MRVQLSFPLLNQKVPWSVWSSLRTGLSQYRGAHPLSRIPLSDTLLLRAALRNEVEANCAQRSGAKMSKGEKPHQSIPDDGCLSPISALWHLAEQKPQQKQHVFSTSVCFPVVCGTSRSVLRTTLRRFLLTTECATASTAPATALRCVFITPVNATQFRA